MNSRAPHRRRSSATCYRFVTSGLAALLGLLSLAGTGHSQQPPAAPDEPPLRELPLREFMPVPRLKVPSHLLTRAKFPVVDVHTHFRYRLHHSREQLDQYVDLMNRHNIAVCISLDGGLGDALREHTEYLWSKYPDRFIVFANLDWQGAGTTDKPETWACNQPGFSERTAGQLKEAKQAGASGLKIFKQFGLEYQNPDGSLIKIDDRRFDPIWAACGELGLPILIHTADPAAFFDPTDATNERWEELSRHPEWSFADPRFPRREELFAAFNRVVARHPRTTFIAAHVANNPEDLAAVAEWLDTYPNLHVELASRIGELGRQPYSARRFLTQYADRVMFGTDGPWPELRLTYYWRFLETLDEYFPYSEKPFPPQGFWRIYGVELSDDVLRKIYHGNAARLIPGVAEKLERAGNAHTSQGHSGS